MRKPQEFMVVMWKQAAKLVTGGGIAAILTIVERVLGHGVGVYILLPTTILLMGIAFYRAWEHENRIKEELLARLASPILRGSVDQLLMESFITTSKMRDWIVAVKISVTNFTPGTTTIGRVGMQLFTATGSHSSERISGVGLTYWPFVGSDREYLDRLQLPMNPAPDGFAYAKGYSGWLCFRVHGADLIEDLKPVTVTIVIDDALGNRHEIRGAAPWQYLGVLYGPPYD